MSTKKTPYVYIHLL